MSDQKNPFLSPDGQDTSSTTSHRRRRSFLNVVAAAFRRSSPTPSNPFDDPPPSYDEVVPSSSSAAESSSAYPQDKSGGTRPRLTKEMVTNKEDEYAFLSHFDTLFLIDDSGSMAGYGRWEEARTALALILPVCVEHDKDGVDIYFLNHKNTNPRVDGRDAKGPSAGTGYRHVKSAQAVMDIFNGTEPNGWTPTGERLGQILQAYLTYFERQVRRNGVDDHGVKPVNIIVITDGCPNSQELLESVIVVAAERLRKQDALLYQVGIQFFQVGDNPNAAEFLTKLDQNIREEHQLDRDMVDTVPFNARTCALTDKLILKTVLGAVVKRLDDQTL
ncbi:hypothetical protein DL766_004921 [Monosporascus sp. MC13-8B]|uniref:VWFA domain-containing protein n=1 Tax=Monosporascus cannonballus TaxID=155416 RepID=A0ABY0HGU7_9PEZI|nr:hypothetical protein DL763_010203 [Monosporascus cannonballus]RYO92791.1 hypothetical protein DL762_001497 [Monosporascus cannonballus]RYP30320.1 hypothetical protein DL766_004921 [Monosporascus sp. MC13-8B]